MMVELLGYSSNQVQVLHYSNTYRLVPVDSPEVRVVMILLFQILFFENTAVFWVFCSNLLNFSTVRF